MPRNGCGIMHQVGTLTGDQSDRAAQHAISPDQYREPMLTVAPAFGADGFNTPSLLGGLRQRALFPQREAQTFGGGIRRRHRSELPSRGTSTLARGHGRARPICSTATRAPSTDLIAFVRTIDERTPPFPPADLAPNDPVFADAAALCDCRRTRRWERRRSTAHRRSSAWSLRMGPPRPILSGVLLGGRRRCAGLVVGAAT
jgi:hypothetical protein